jgi:uncharacterized protein with NRDE domain
MCTLIVGHRTQDGESLIVGANRDEALGRPASPPAIVEKGDRRILAPRDERAGGTWLGLNDGGVFAGLTNRFGRPADADRRSRGELVFSALDAPTAREAAEAIDEIPAVEYNPFHMVVADAETAHLVVSDGERLTCGPVGAGFAVVTERSFGAADNSRKRVLRRRVDELEGESGVGLDELRELLSDCSGGIDAVCVDLEEIDYGTRSSTLIRLGPEGDAEDVEFWHAEGAPCDVDYEDLSGLAQELLQQG